MKDHGLLQKRKARRAEIQQTAKLFELLPHAPNDLWQMDVTYIHIPGCGWWYAVTVIDYYSRYLLGCHLTPSYSALETAYALKLAWAEAERIHGPLAKRPFLVADNRSSFLARRFTAFVADQYRHVRIQYRTPQQLGPARAIPRNAQDRGSLLAAVRPSAALRRVPGRISPGVQRAAPAWGAGPRGQGRSVGRHRSGASRPGRASAHDASNPLDASIK